MEYKIGDKITIKPKHFFLNHKYYDNRLQVISYGDLSPGFNGDMLKYCGKSTIIVGFRNMHKKIYIIEVDKQKWNWAKWMFISREEKIEEMLK